MSDTGAKQFYCAIDNYGPMTRTVRFCPGCKQPTAKNLRPWPPPGPLEDAQPDEPVDSPDGRETPQPGRRTSSGATTRDGAGLALRFPWGVVSVVGRLAVGRDGDFSPLATDLAPYDNVSREHAEIWSDEGRLYVTDIGSTNGTFVNDSRVGIDEQHELRRGDRVRFASRLVVEVVGEEHVE